MDRVDYDSEHTVPPFVGNDLDKLADEMDGFARDELEEMMDEFLDEWEKQIAINPARPPEDPLFLLMHSKPEPGSKDVTLYVGETEDYHELGISYADRFFRPWVGKYRSNGDGEIFYPIEVADGGFPEYNLELDDWPEELSREGESTKDFNNVRPLTEEEKGYIRGYLEKKRDIVSKYDVDEIPEKLEEPRRELRENFSHLG